MHTISGTLDDIIAFVIVNEEAEVALIRDGSPEFEYLGILAAAISCSPADNIIRVRGKLITCIYRLNAYPNASGGLGGGSTD